MHIRVMTLEDYQAARSLWDRTPGMGLRSIDDSLAGIGKFLARNPVTCFVAEEEGHIAGTILCGHDGRRGYIYHTAVDPYLRRRGIGKALVDAALDALKAEGILKAALVVFSTNSLGNGFWEAMGFSKRDDLTYRNRSLREDNL